MEIYETEGSFFDKIRKFKGLIQIRENLITCNYVQKNSSEMENFYSAYRPKSFDESFFASTEVSK